MSVLASATPSRLDEARVLVELGELYDAEARLVEHLDEQPDDLDALSLYAKIKHMRGELSQAIGCWAKVHARASARVAAQTQLRAIFHLATDPEAGAGEFVALGQMQLARKPAVQLELEQAFSQFLRRRPEEARQTCDRLALRHRDRDREVYKLARLASAWIAELSGDLAEACNALEALGRERGFETDLDRVLALVGLYERIGTPERLEAALHICLYLHANFEKISVLGRLASLTQRLGREQIAREYEGQYLAAFRRRMHRPTRAEVVRVAAGQYLPLPKLVRLPLPDPALLPGSSQRERALADALSGDLAGARALLSEGESLLDQKYLADLAVLEDDLGTAVRRYLDVLRVDQDDIRIATWLLELYEQTRDPAIAAFFADPELGQLVRGALEDASRATPLRPSLFRALATLLSLQPVNPDEANHWRAHAEALSEAHRRDTSPVGRVLAAAAYHFLGTSKGLIHELWASRDPAPNRQGGSLPMTSILGNLSPELRQAIQNVFISVREYARSKFPHLTTDLRDYTYTFKITKEDEPSYGLSAGLPAAVAFLSVFLQRPVPQDVALSGIISADSHDVLVVRAVGDTEHKVKGAYNRNLRQIVLPLQNRAELAQNALVPPVVQAELVRYVADLDQAVRLVLGEDLFRAPLRDSDYQRTVAPS